MKKKHIQLKKKETALVHVSSLLNNTFITLTTLEGSTLAWASGGTEGFKGSRRATSYAAQITGEKIGKACMQKGLVHVAARLKGPGYGKEASLRGLKMAGVKVVQLQDVSRIPYNGCRLKRKRRV
jgi:small subunit ribosomal protein S11